jgi:hypothetical protein
VWAFEKSLLAVARIEKDSQNPKPVTGVDTNIPDVDVCMGQLSRSCKIILLFLLIWF